MAVNLVVNGVSYSYPQTGDQNWGDGATNWATAVTSGMLQKGGGSFTLTADVDFGAGFGLKASKFASRNANPASTGIVRLANTDAVSWRNNANSADIALAKDASDRLTWAGNPIVSGAGIVPVAAGGTGVGTLAAHGVLVGEGTGNVAVVAPGTSGLPLVAQGASADPIYAALGVSGGGTGVTAIPAAAGASAFAAWDANVNLSAANHLEGFSSTATAAGTTTLLVGSNYLQYFTGASTQTCALPVVTTLVNGQSFLITNLSSGNVTVQTSGGNTVQVMAANTQLLVTVKDKTAGTGTASWSWVYGMAQSAALPASLGGTGVASVTTAPTASSFAGWDANSNLSANNLIEGYRTTATAAGTTTLAVGDKFLQYFTGATTQTCVLPVAATLVNGQQFLITNMSSGNVTVQTSGGNTVQVMTTQTQLLVTCINTAGGTGTASWNWVYGSAQSAALPISMGGTGASTQQTALNAIAPAGAVAGQVVGFNGTNWVAQTIQAGTKNYVTYTNFENNALTGWNWCNAGTLTNGIPTGTPNFTAVSANALYAFTISTSTTCAVGDTYTNNAQTFTVVTALAAVTGTVFFATGTGDPLASGTLTRATGAGTASITYSAFTKETLSIVSSGQLAGTNSLSLATSGVTTAGLGYCSDAITIDKEDQAKVLSFRFYYSAITNPANANWSGSSSNSFGVAVYDVTNSAWLGTAGGFNFIQSAGVGICQGTFQTGATTSQIRLVVYNVSATTGAVTLYFDDFYVGPQALAFGPAMSDWVAFTPTGAWNTNTTYTGWYRRKGDSVDLIYQVAVAGGSPNAATLTLNLPSGMTIDTTKLPSNNIYTFFGGLQGKGAGNNFVGNLQYNTSTTLAPTYTLDGSTASIMKCGSITQAAPYAFTTNDLIVAVALDVPIVGWSSNTVLSTDSNTRVVAFNATTPSGTIDNSGTQVNSWTVNRDTHGGWNGSTTYTIPVSGYYWVDACFRVDATFAAGNYVFVVLNKNGSNIFNTFDRASGAQVSMQPRLSNIFYFNAGDALKIINQSNATSPTFAGGSQYDNFSLFLLNGPATVAASETVVASYNNFTNSGAVLTTGVGDLVVWSNKDTDSHNAMSGGTYTVPVSGTYRIYAQVTTNMSATTSTMSAIIQKNGSTVRQSDYQASPTITSRNYNAAVEYIAKCNAGDTLTIRCLSGTGSTTYFQSNTYDYVHIQRVGN